MKKIKRFSSFILILTMALVMFNNMRSVQAQEQARSVAVNVEVFLAINGNDPINQDQISYDILQYNPQTGMNDVVYSYESTNPLADNLVLAEGSYTFRLYDGGNFERDGNELLAYKAEMTNPNASEVEGEQSETMKVLENSGSFVSLDDGTKIYDLPFEVTAEDNLYKPSTNQYETRLVITIADQSSVAVLDEGTNNPEQTGEEVGELILHVLGDDSSFVEGAVIVVNGVEYQTDAQGLIQISNLPVGNAEIEIISLPEGYTTESTQVQALEIQANSTNTSTLTVERIPEEPTTNTVIFTFENDGEAVPNVSVTLNDREIYSDTNGEAVFTDIAVGEHAYAINSVPQGYFIDNLTGTTTVVAGEASQVSIEVKNEASSSVLFNVVNESQEVVSGVGIQINNSIITTDENGQAFIENLVAGGHSYEVINAPEMYELPVEKSVNVDSQSQTEVTITLTTNQQFGSALLTITDADSNPMVGAEIILNNEDSFVTNGQGQVLIEDLEAGSYNEYYVSALPEGYELEGEAETRSFTVVKDQQVEDTMTVNLAEQLGSVSFTLLDENNNPIEGTVIAIGLDTLATDASGVATFNQIVSGEQTYEIRGLEGRYEGDLSGTVEVVTNQTIEEVINLTAIEQVGAVTFKVIDQNDEVVEAAEIELNNQTYTTDSAGQVTIEGLTVGQAYNYTLTSLPENYSGQASGVVIPTADTAVVETIVVERSIPLGQLTITVVDQDNEPVNGAVIQLNQSVTTTTNAEGQAVFNDLEEATYDYTIQSLPDNYENITNSQSVYIAEGASESRQLQVRRYVANGTIIFNVRDQDEYLVKGVIINVAGETFETNTEGTTTASDIEPGDHTYTVSSLPDGYKGEISGQVTVNESKVSTVEFHVEREVELSKATFTIVDQHNQAVEGVNLAFGGLTGLSNESGRVHFDNLEPGRYNYSVNEVPSGFENTFEGGALDVEEGSEYDESIEIEKLPETGTARIHITAEGKAIEDVTVIIDDQTISTNNEGYAIFDDLAVGNHNFVLTELPQDFEFKTIEGTVEVIADEISTVEIQATAIEESSVEESSNQEESSSIMESNASQESSSHSSSSNQPTSSIIVDESHSLTPQEQASIDEEASQATRQFKDNETGIEVWVNPQDANNIESLTVEKLTSSAAIENADADIYRLTLLDNQNKPVQLTKIAEVKIPTRPVNSQLRIMRLNNNSVSNLTFALHNNRVTFRTQQLGDFAVVYNAEQASISHESDQTSVSVSVESSVEDDDLPNTGERSLRDIVIMIAISLICIAYLLLNNKRRKDA
ncbi:collagen binding domain-containing protein [Aerococcaceae bacterium WGS1372]